MNKTSAISSLGFFLILGIALPAVFPKGYGAGSLANVKTLILYDAASGAVPGTPLMGFTDFPPGVAAPIFSNDATILDTTSAGVDTYAGWTANEAMTPAFPVLDRTEGFRLDFTLQIENESHNHNHTKSRATQRVARFRAKAVQAVFAIVLRRGSPAWTTVRSM